MQTQNEEQKSQDRVIHTAQFTPADSFNTQSLEGKLSTFLRAAESAYEKFTAIDTKALQATRSNFFEEKLQQLPTKMELAEYKRCYENSLYVLLAPEYLFGKAYDENEKEKYADNFGIYSKQDKNMLIEELRQFSKNHPKMLIIFGVSFITNENESNKKKRYKNKAMIFKNGEYISYNKKAESEDKMYTESSSIEFIPGKKKGLFEIDGLRAGIEICADHSDAILSDSLDNDTVDLHFLISNSVRQIGSYVPIKKSGWLMHADPSTFFERGNFYKAEQSEAKLERAKESKSVRTIPGTDNQDEQGGELRFSSHLFMAAPPAALQKVSSQSLSATTLRSRKSPSTTSDDELDIAVTNGRVAVVIKLLAERTKNLESKQISAMTTPLLYIAAKNGHADLVKELLAAGADPNAVRGSDGSEIPAEEKKFNTPLLIAIKNNFGRVVEALLTTDLIDPNQATESGMTPLFIAAMKGHAKNVEQLLAAKADANKTCYDKSSPIMAAAQTGRVEILKRLLAADANPNQIHMSGATSLYVAAEAGHFKIVKILLAEQVDPNQANNFGNTPLFKAAHNGHLEVVNALLAHEQTNPNQANNAGSTPLSVATLNGHYKIVLKLLTMHVDPNPKDKKGITPLDIAQRDYRIRIATLIGCAMECRKILDKEKDKSTHLYQEMEKCYQRCLNESDINNPVLVEFQELDDEINKLREIHQPHAHSTFKPVNKELHEAIIQAYKAFADGHDFESAMKRLDGFQVADSDKQSTQIINRWREI